MGVNTSIRDRETTRAQVRPGVEGGNRRPGPSQCLFRVRKMVIKHPRAWLGCAGAAGSARTACELRGRASAAMAAGYAPARRGSTSHSRPWLPFGALSARRRRGIRLYPLGVAIGGTGRRLRQASKRCKRGPYRCRAARGPMTQHREPGRRCTSPGARATPDLAARLPRRDRPSAETAPATRGWLGSTPATPDPAQLRTNGVGQRN